MGKLTVGLRNTFLVHSILSALSGLMFLLAPQWWEMLSGADIWEPFIYRVLGSVLLSLAASSWLAYKADAWDKVRILVQLEMIGTVLGTLVVIIGLILGDFPVLGWVFAILGAGFAAAFITCFVAQEKGVKQTAPAEEKQQSV